MSIEDISKISNKNDFIVFIKELRNDLEVNPENWENVSLESYLEAMQRWLEDSEGWEHYYNIDLSKLPPWQVIAHLLGAASVYE